MALSVRPTKSFAISAHRLPYCACAWRWRERGRTRVSRARRNEKAVHAALPGPHLQQPLVLLLRPLVAADVRVQVVVPAAAAARRSASGDAQHTVWRTQVPRRLQRHAPLAALLADAAGQLRRDLGPGLGPKLSHEAHNRVVLLQNCCKSGLQDIWPACTARRAPCCDLARAARRQSALCAPPHLLRPGSLDEVRVEHLLPAVQALHVRAVREELGCGRWRRVSVPARRGAVRRRAARGALAAAREAVQGGSPRQDAFGRAARRIGTQSRTAAAHRSSSSSWRCTAPRRGAARRPAGRAGAASVSCRVQTIAVPPEPAPLLSRAQRRRGTRRGAVSAGAAREAGAAGRLGRASARDAGGRWSDQLRTSSGVHPPLLDRRVGPPTGLRKRRDARASARRGGLPARGGGAPNRPALDSSSTHPVSGGSVATSAASMRLLGLCRGSSISTSILRFWEERGRRLKRPSFFLPPPCHKRAAPQPLSPQ